MRRLKILIPLMFALLPFLSMGQSLVSVRAECFAGSEESIPPGRRANEFQRHFGTGVQFIQSDGVRKRLYGNVTYTMFPLQGTILFSGESDKNSPNGLTYKLSQFGITPDSLDNLLTQCELGSGSSGGGGGADGVVTSGTLSPAGTLSLNTSAPSTVNINGFYTGPNVSTSTAAPIGSGSQEGDIHIDTALDVIYVWDGSAWQEAGGGVATVTAQNSITGDGSGGSPLQLVNDAASPGNSQYYGTDAGGTKGFFALPSGGGLTVYDAESGGGTAMVKATAAGVTFSRASGVGIFVIPSGVEVVSARIEGVSADLGGANDFQIVFDYATATYNTAISDMFMPMIQVVNTAAQLGGGPTPALPFIQDEGSDPQPQTSISVGSGDITARVINLNAFSNWNIMLNL